MKFVRSCLFAFLAVLLLPWGAYSASFHSGRAAEVSDQLDGVHPAYVISAKKRCRAATLPGSPCGPDIEHRAQQVVFAAPALVQSADFRDVWRGVSLSHAPPKAPPRFS